MVIQVVLGLNETVDDKTFPLNVLADALKVRYPNAIVCVDMWTANVHDDLINHYQTTPLEPIVLLAHSYGNAAIYYALRNTSPDDLQIAHWLMLDPVPRWMWGQNPWNCWKIPNNVLWATNYNRPAILPPWPAKILNTSDHYVNKSVPGATHNGVISTPWVQQEIFTTLDGYLPHVVKV